MALFHRAAADVPSLGPQDALPTCPRRVLVAGVSGSGKTTLSRRIAARLNVQATEIDALYHGAGWIPRREFAADVTALASRPEWITEWQYSSARALLAARADLVVWLDLPVARTMVQVTGRSVRRRLRREVLWNGNIEPPLWTIVTRRDHVIRWAWTTRHKYRGLLSALAADRPELPIVRLPSHRAAAAWLEGPLSAAARPADPAPGTRGRRRQPAAADQDRTPPAG